MIIRGTHKHSYTIVPNEIFTHGMSKGACGILAYLIGKHEEWKVSAASLAKVFSCGRDAILTDLRELERFGYAQRRSGGKSGGFAWIIADSPITGKSDSRETRKSAFPTLQSKEEETSKEKEQSKETPPAVSLARSACVVKPKITSARKPPQPVSANPPSLQEVRAYCREKGFKTDPSFFYKFFTESDWVDSNGKFVYSWKQKLVTWEKMNQHRPPQRTESGDLPACGYTSWI